MNILVIGSACSFEEVKGKFAAAHVCSHAVDHVQAQAHLPVTQVVFDYLLMEDSSRQAIYARGAVPIFVHSVNRSLADAIRGSANMFFGFNGWPGSWERPLLEVSLHQPAHRSVLDQVCDQLGVAYRVVDDRVGLVTPRVISMIINEAFYTVQDGTATRADIDQAMKLGTSYPEGPFAWCTRIGIQNIYRLLEALYDDTHDERYKAAPLLKKEYLQSLST